jgi:hypothetical protein
VYNTEDHGKKRHSHSKQPFKIEKKDTDNRTEKYTDRDIESSKTEHLSTKIKLKRRSSDIQITNDYLKKNGRNKISEATK